MSIHSSPSFLHPSSSVFTFYHFNVSHSESAEKYILMKQAVPFGLILKYFFMEIRRQRRSTYRNLTLQYVPCCRESTVPLIMLLPEQSRKASLSVPPRLSWHPLTKTSEEQGRITLKHTARSEVPSFSHVHVLQKAPGGKACKKCISQEHD